MPRWIFILSLLIALVGIGDHELWTPDEPREAAIILSMSRSGNLLVPDLAGEPFVEKPPLAYVVASVALRLFTPVLERVTAIRLVSALWGLGTLLMTFLLARRLFGREAGLLALPILATMPGFIHVTHWILVDNALMFFVVAALWALTEFYIGRRAALLPLAGLLAAGAFLSKGWIGPIIIGCGWIGLVVPWILRDGWRECLRRPVLAWHGLAAFCFFAPALGWMAAFRLAAGPKLWHEWFWQNHFGRLTGQAVQLGHMQGPWYYFGILPVYVLPWVVAIAVWIKNIAFALWRKNMPTPADLFVICWGLGGLALLSLSATKRDIYLAVLAPAFALIAADMLCRQPQGRFFQYVFKVWLGALLTGMLGMVLAPFPCLHAWTGGWGWKQILAGGTLLVGVLILTRLNYPLLWRGLAVTALCYIMGIGLLLPVVDRYKNYAPAFAAISANLNAVPDARPASWNFDETTRAGFYYYCGLVFPALSDTNEVLRVLRGEHALYDGVVAFGRQSETQDDFLELNGVRRGAVRMGRRRLLRWFVRGDRNNKVEDD